MKQLSVGDWRRMRTRAQDTAIVYRITSLTAKQSDGSLKPWDKTAHYKEYNVSVGKDSALIIFRTAKTRESIMNHNYDNATDTIFQKFIKLLFVRNDVEIVESYTP
jgi:hypothetical protein